MDDIRNAVWAAVYAREFSRWHENGVRGDEASAVATSLANTAVHYMPEPAHLEGKS